MFDAVWNGDSEGITKEMNALLRRTISYHDYREDFYHAFLAGIFTGAGYMVDSNKEHLAYKKRIKKNEKSSQHRSQNFLFSPLAEMASEAKM